MSTFTAKYATGTCTECQSPIKPREEISKAVDAGYVHVECPITELDKLIGKPICQSCWVIGPCDCE